MKEFDLELVKQGHPVVTRDGYNARIICFNSKHKDYPIVALVSDLSKTYESVERYTINGKYYVSSEKPDPLDLMMASQKHEGWINLYKDKDSIRPWLGNHIFNSEQEAKDGSNCRDSIVQHVATIKIEWEE